MDIFSTETLINIVVSSLLDWPFLSFVIVLFILWRFWKPLKEAIKQRGFSIEIGGNKLTTGEAVQAIDDELKQSLTDFKETMDSIHSLQSQVNEMQGKIQMLRGTSSDADQIIPEPVSISRETQQQRDKNLWKLVSNSLFHGKSVWRSLERLSILAGVPEEKIREIIEAHSSEVVMSIGKLDRPIVRHKNRIPFKRHNLEPDD